MYFKLSLDYSQYQRQCKSYENSCKYNVNARLIVMCLATASFAFLELSGYFSPNIFKLWLNVEPLGYWGPLYFLLQTSKDQMLIATGLLLLLNLLGFEDNWTLYWNLQLKPNVSGFPLFQTWFFFSLRLKILVSNNIIKYLLYLTKYTK